MPLDEYLFTNCAVPFSEEIMKQYLCDHKPEIFL